MYVIMQDYGGKSPIGTGGVLILLIYLGRGPRVTNLTSCRFPDGLGNGILDTAASIGVANGS